MVGMGCCMRAGKQESSASILAFACGTASRKQHAGYINLRNVDAHGGMQLRWRLSCASCAFMLLTADLECETHTMTMLERLTSQRLHNTSRCRYLNSKALEQDAVASFSVTVLSIGVLVSAALYQVVRCCCPCAMLIECIYGQDYLSATAVLLNGNVSEPALHPIFSQQ